MNTRFSRSALSLVIAASGLLLTACGGSSGSSDSGDAHEHEHEHEHSGRVLISDSGSTTLHVFDQAEEAFETLDDDAPANGSTLVLADNGLSAAVLGNNSVYFVHSGLEEHDDDHDDDHDEHEHEEASTIDFTITGSSVGPVITSRGHFSVLADGETQLVPAEDIESVTEAETFSAAPQTYPALVLDEATETMLAFTGGSATVYVDGVAGSTTQTCATPYLAAESEHITLFGCGTDSLYFISQEGDFDAIDEVDIPDGVTSWPSDWITNGDEIVGYDGYTLIQLDTTETTVGDTELVNVTANNVTTMISSSYAPGLFCSAAYATELSGYAAVVSSDGFVYIVDTDDEGGVQRIQLEDSDPSTLLCGDLSLAPAAEGFVVADDQAGQLYFIDAHDGESFHIHETHDLSSSITGIADMVFMHAIEGGEHDHDHEH